MQIFNAIVQSLGLKSKSGLVLDVPHRWNSTYDMLNEALKYKAALNKFAEEHHYQAPSEDEWSKAEALHGFLQEFSDATKAFFADRHPTAHLYLKMVLAIRYVLLDETWNSDELLSALADSMYEKFAKYWSKPNTALLIAAVLDPSMKTDYLKFYFYTISADVDMEDAFAQFASQNSDSRKEKTELDAYLDDPRVVVKSDESFNVIAWWKKNSDAYPILSLMARDFLAIPVSTVSSESAFSAAGRILGKDRTSLSPDTLEALICSKDWLIGFNDEEEGEPLTGQRMFGDDEEEGEI
ncbi:unnamed protein product [Urochloa humidicola]